MCDMLAAESARSSAFRWSERRLLIHPNNNQFSSTEKNIMSSATHIFKLDRLFVLLAAGLFMAAAVSSTLAAAVKPNARFDKVWVDYDVSEEGKYGMRIHLKFTVYEMKGVSSYVRITYLDSDNQSLKDNNKSFYTKAGDVATFRSLKPAYEPTDYDDLALFMPYSELDLIPGKYNLQMDLDLIYEDGELIQHLGFKDFEYTKSGSGGSENSPSSNISARYDKTWVDYDITEGGRLGMRIHTKFSVSGMKGVDGDLRIYFQKSDGTSLKSTDGQFESKLGNVAAFVDLKPAYDPAEYNDLAVFVPYNEFHLGPGKYTLKMDVDLIDGQGNLLQHLGFLDFDYWKK